MEGLGVDRGLNFNQYGSRCCTGGGSLLGKAWDTCLLDPMDSVCGRKSIYCIDSGAACSCCADDDVAADLNECLETREQPTVRVALALNANFDAVDGYDDRDVNSDEPLLNDCQRIFAF